MCAKNGGRQFIPERRGNTCIGFFVKKGDRVTERRCTGRLHPFQRVSGVTEG